MLVAVAPGKGRAIRHGPHLAFSHEPIPELYELIVNSASEEQLFKDVAGLILRMEFRLPSFAIVATSAAKAFLFGDATLTTLGDGVSVSAADASTWRELNLTDRQLQAGFLGPTEPDNDDTNLVQGSVPASSLRWRVQSPAVSPPKPTPLKPPVTSDPPQSDPTLAPSTAPNHLAKSSAASTTPTWTDSAVLPNNWAEDPEDTTSTVGGFAEVSAPDQATLDEQSTTGLMSDASDNTLTPPPIAFSSDTAAVETGSRWQVAFDDGNVVFPDKGLIVGRNPTKEPLPDGYASVVIRSEQVSRRHWELTISGRHATIRDLQSMTGTTATSGNGGFREIIPSDLDTPITSEIVVTFGDRTATITRQD